MPPSAKFQRWVDIITALLAHRVPVTFDELAREVPGYAGKTKPTQKRMFERDKRELKAFGVPITTVGGEGDDESAYRMATTDFYLPYLSVATPRGLSQPRRVDRYGYRAITTLAFEPDELEAVAAGARRARALGDRALAADIASAMRKLAFDLPLDGAAERGTTQLLTERDRVDPDALEALGAALVARKVVHFEYHSMTTDRTTRRRVEPYGLFFLSSHWYLAGRDAEQGELRNFRVSRIAGLSVSAAREDSPDYTIPPTFRLREHARSRQPWELGDGDAVAAVVELRRESGAAMAAAALGEPIPGEPRRRRFEVRRVDAFARWLLSFAGDAVPVAPAEVVDEFRRLVDATLALYERSREQKR
jgi:predicted DNA-binding transcriptional regulator YafY